MGSDSSKVALDSFRRIKSNEAKSKFANIALRYNSKYFHVEVNDNNLSRQESILLIHGFFRKYDNCNNPKGVFAIVKQYYGSGHTSIRVSSDHKAKMLLIHCRPISSDSFDDKSYRAIKFSFKYAMNDCTHACYGGTGWSQIGLIGMNIKNPMFDSATNLDSFCASFPAIDCQNMKFRLIHRFLNKTGALSEAAVKSIQRNVSYHYYDCTHVWSQEPQILTSKSSAMKRDSSSRPRKHSDFNSENTVGFSGFRMQNVFYPRLGDTIEMSIDRNCDRKELDPRTGRYATVLQVSCALIPSGRNAKLFGSTCMRRKAEMLTNGCEYVPAIVVNGCDCVKYGGVGYELKMEYVTSQSVLTAVSKHLS